MPPHPLPACYCHVIEDGLANIAKHQSQPSKPLLENELEHVRAVTEILTSYLLYYPHDPRWDPAIHDRYWNEIRPKYLTNTDCESRKQLAVAWEFLAFATRGSDFRDEIVRENRDLFA